MEKEEKKKKEIDRYKIAADNIEVDVIIESTTEGAKYRIVSPKWEPATLALIKEIRHELVTEVNVSTQEILDPSVIDSLKKKFADRASSIIKKKLPKINDILKRKMIGSLIHDMLGLGDLEFLLNDENLEEVIINSSHEPVRVYHKKMGWLVTNVVIQNEAIVQNYASIIARRVGRQTTTLNPLLDAHLVTGDRANAVLYPISTKGSTITIRKFARDPWTVTDLIKNKTCNAELFSLIWMAFQYEMSVLVSGGTGSGKTSFLNVCMPFIPPNHRIISIEDTRELQLPKFLYWCPLTTRPANPEGKGEINMLDLLINSLRMRPDRIILGEVRKGRDAEVAFEAMHTGHSVYATLHADDITQTIRRLIYPPINIPANMLEAVNLNIVVFRDRRRNLRRVLQVGEFIASEEEEGKIHVRPNIIYRWKPGEDKIVPHANPLRLFEDLSRNTGMSLGEIKKDLQVKKTILEYLVKNNIRSINEIGKITNEYYLNRDFVVDHIMKKGDPKILLK
jgi:flagellar protein FlaI